MFDDSFNLRSTLVRCKPVTIMLRNTASMEYFITACRSQTQLKSRQKASLKRTPNHIPTYPLSWLVELAWASLGITLHPPIHFSRWNGSNKNGIIFPKTSLEAQGTQRDGDASAALLNRGGLSPLVI